MKIRRQAGRADASLAAIGLNDDVLTRLSHISRRVRAATPGPWGYNSSTLFVGSKKRTYAVPMRNPKRDSSLDQVFIAHARNDVPFLLDLVERLSQAQVRAIATPAPFTGRPGQCRICHCTTLHACVEGCGWVDEFDRTLCTQCTAFQHTTRENVIALGRALGLIGRKERPRRLDDVVLRLNEIIDAFAEVGFVFMPGVQSSTSGKSKASAKRRR